MEIDFYMYEDLDDFGKWQAKLNVQKMIDLCLVNDLMYNLFQVLDCSTEDNDYYKHMIFDFEGAIIGPVIWLKDDDYEQGIINVNQVFLFDEDVPIRLEGEALTNRYKTKKFLA